MQAQAIAQRGLAVARGYGLKVYVRHGQLVVEDGVGRDRRERRYTRVSGLRRLVLLGHTGYVTLEAQRWLRDAKASLAQIDADGQLVAMSTSAGSDLAPLRRAQAIGSAGPTGLEVARRLLDDKVAGQASLACELPGRNASEPALGRALAEIRQASTLDDLLAAEAIAADAYWQAWSELPIDFGRNSAHAPEHWRTFGARHSPLSGSPRSAANPPNAILNYLYALLEAETTIACQIVGLDPGLGIFHADQRQRASLALDTMEACRPAVDAYVLALLTQRTLARRDFIETRQGNCRLLPRLTEQLAQTCEAWRYQVAPAVENVVQAFAAAADKPLPLTTPLTRNNHKAAWNGRRSKPPRQAQGRVPGLPTSCQDCGAPLPHRRRRYCDNCRQHRWEADASRGAARAGELLAEMRAEQRDPAHGGRAGKIRGRKNAAHQHAVRAWTGERPDPWVFRSEILPGLRQIPIVELVSATGLSEHYCSLIRLGKRVPHPRHWDALQKIDAVPVKAR